MSRLQQLTSLRKAIFQSPRDIPRSLGGHILNSKSHAERMLLYYPPNVNVLNLSKEMKLSQGLTDTLLEIRLDAEERGAARGKEFRVKALGGWQKKSGEKKSKSKKRR